MFHNKEIEVYILHMKKMVGGVSYNNEIEFRLNPREKGELGGGSSSIGFDLFRNPCEKSSSPEKDQGNEEITKLNKVNTFKF